MPLYQPPQAVSVSGAASSGTLALVSTGTLYLAGSNLTLSQNGNSLTLSVNTAAGAGLSSAGISGGNTAGATAYQSGSIVFAGGNNITLSGATAVGGQTYTISAASQTVQTQNCVDVTLASGAGGATSGTLALVSSGTLTLAAGNNITLSQLGNAVTISGPNTAAGAAPTLNWYQNAAGVASGTMASSHGTLYLFPLSLVGPFPGNMTAGTMFWHVSGAHTNTSASTDAHTYTWLVGLYTRTASTLNLLNSVSTTWSFGANSAISSVYNGQRYLTIAGSQFATATLSLSQTDYVVGHIALSGGTNFPLSYMMQSYQSTASHSGTVGLAGSSNNSMGPFPFFGALASSTAALPAAVNITDIRKVGVGAPVQALPHLILENQVSSW